MRISLSPPGPSYRRATAGEITLAGQRVDRLTERGWPRRYWATARALGTTPRQVIAGLSAAEALPALPALAGALLGIPAGSELYARVQGAGYRGSPPSWWLLAMVAGMLLAAASLTAVPARIGVRRPVSEIPQAEAT
jgi:putative ABC transport system permease protein